MQWPLPFAHYSFDRVEHRAKLNRQTADVQHSCSRCYLFLLFVNIVFSVLLLWMATERHQCCTSSIFQQAGKHTGSTWAPKTSQTNQEELACVFQWCLRLLHSHPAGASQCHAGSQAGWDENTKGNRPPPTPLQPPFLCQAGRNELLNRDAAVHGETCVNKVGVKITAEAHGVGAKRRRASFMRE